MPIDTHRGIAPINAGSIPIENATLYKKDWLQGYKQVKQQGGEIIKDNQGQYNHPGKVTEINSPQITMKNVPYNVLGVSKETGEQILMRPEQEYFFKNTQNVIEYPQLTEKEKAFLKYIKNNK